MSEKNEKKKRREPSIAEEMSKVTITIEIDQDGGLHWDYSKPIPLVQARAVFRTILQQTEDEMVIDLVKRTIGTKDSVMNKFGLKQ